MIAFMFRRSQISVFLTGLLASMAALGGVVVIPGDPTKQVMHGKLVTATGVVDSKLVIENDTIACVGESCNEPAGATRYQVTDAFIFPGFIDAHNHVAYNALPKWTPAKRYINRGQWQRDPAYKAFKKPYDTMKSRGLLCEMVKYGEIKALLSGITTIQGAPNAQKCFGTLIRNAESENGLGIPSAQIRTYILDIKGFDAKLDWNKTKSFVVHLSEGLDEKSRREFDVLEQKGLLTGSTAIIHGSAFTEAEFMRMGEAGAKLIWSPQSNLALYGDTTRIDLARQHGVPVSLGIDWNATGSDNLFDEMRVGQQVNKERFSEAISMDDWVKMVTINPATALSLDPQLGSLEPGKKADIAVVQLHDDDPGKSLMKSHLPDVELVQVGGKTLYGNESIVEAIKPGVCESLVVQGARKRVCVADSSSNRPKSGQTLATIMKRLADVYPQLAGLSR